MEKNISFTLILNWLKSTEMFARPSKQLPGKWQLEEYYVETGDELRNITESRLKAAKELWNIEFTADKNYLHECNLPVSFISGIKNGNWNTSQNFITLKFSGLSNESVEFPFATEKEQLKLLKKDEKGSIEFFGFFNRIR